MQQLLFRDWRFALLWAIGLTAGVAAFFSQGGGHEQLVKSAAEIKAARQGLPIFEIPVDYRRRIGVSKVSGTVSGTIRAGVKILWVIGREAMTARSGTRSRP